MNKWVSKLAAMAMALAACGGGGSKEALEIGDPAPAFDLPGSDGATHRLEDYRGRRAVVLAWFPKAFTGG